MAEFMARRMMATAVQQEARIASASAQQTASTAADQMATLSPEVRDDRLAYPVLRREGADDIHTGLTTIGLKKLFDNQARLRLAIREIDADGAMARASVAEGAAAASAARAADSATLAGGAAEVAAAAQPILEALQRMEGRLTAMEGRLSAIELKQDVAASGCCVLM